MLSKKCYNYCPDCGATDPDIEWGDKKWVDEWGFQEAICKKCNCNFREYYKYFETEYEIKMTRKRWEETTYEGRLVWLESCCAIKKTEAMRIAIKEVNDDDFPDKIKIFFSDMLV